MSKYKTDTEFKKEVFDLVGDEYIFIESYVTSKTKIKVKHNKCGHIYEVKPNNFLTGSRCPYCAKLMRSSKLAKTDSQFKQEVFSLVGTEYTFLDAYVNSQTKIKVKHSKCGNTYKVAPNNFLTGYRCPYCNGGINKDDIQFKHEIKTLVGNEYTFLDAYVNNHTKLRVKHNKCGKIYQVTPNSFLSGTRCPYCAGNIKKNDIQFKQEVRDLVGDEYTFLGTYVNSDTKIRVKHNTCGNVYEVTPHSFLMGTRCPYCYTESKSKTNDEFKQEVYDLVGDEYTFLDTYVNSYTKIKVRHNKCGHIYKVKPNAFFSGIRCPYCSSTSRKTDAQFKQEVFDLVGDEYTFLDSYINIMTKLRVKHNECGHVYYVAPTEFFSHNTRCPYCNSPKGETIITKILNTLNVSYKYQKTFDDLKDTHPLSYDFFIPSQGILIEYQGVQHYQPIDYFGGEDRFKIQQKHDKMKADYAKNHHYNLIAVPYTYDTFSKIKKYLLKHGLFK